MQVINTVVVNSYVNNIVNIANNNQQVCYLACSNALTIYYLDQAAACYQLAKQADLCRSATSTISSTSLRYSAPSPR